LDDGHQQKIRCHGNTVPLSKESVKRLIGHSIAEAECELIIQTLADQRGSRTTAAKLLGFRSALYRTRSTSTPDAEKQCKIERPWSSARFASQADKTAA